MIVFHHAQWSRSSSILWLLEELGAPYEMRLVDVRKRDEVPEEYRGIQPNKKVPAIEHDGTVVTERAAITIHHGVSFPEAGLAPAIGAPERAQYLTWTVYCDSVLDPAICARAHGLAYQSNDYPFGLFDDMVANLERKLTRDRFAAGDRFTAADTQLGSAVAFTMNVLKVLPERPAFKDYVARIAERPAYNRAAEKDASLGMLG